MTVTVTYHMRPEDHPFVVNLSDQIPDLHSIKMDRDSPCSASMLGSRECLSKLYRVIGAYLISTETDEPIHIPSDVAAPLEASDAN